LWRARVRELERDLRQRHQLEYQAQRLALSQSPLSKSERRRQLAVIKSGQHWQLSRFFDLVREMRAAPMVDVQFSIRKLAAGPRPTVANRGGRPRKHADTVDVARDLRDRLTREFQAANRDSDEYEYRQAVERAAVRELADQAGSVLKHIHAGSKPSDVASRIAAKKYDVAVDRVRRGKNNRPRNRYAFKQEDGLDVELAHARNVRKHLGRLMKVSNT
jgi:hypothetical protein